MLIPEPNPREMPVTVAKPLTAPRKPRTPRAAPGADPSRDLSLARDKAPWAFERLCALAASGDPKVELPAIKEILSWAWGKPAQQAGPETGAGLADLARLVALACRNQDAQPPRPGATASQPAPSPQALPETVHA